MLIVSLIGFAHPVAKMQQATSVAVVGAGPAGLAAGACLRKAGLDFIILEKEDQVGASWRRHYARLHLHTVKQYSSLPFFTLSQRCERASAASLLTGIMVVSRGSRGDYAARRRRSSRCWGMEEKSSALWTSLR
jgi:cation diffusion facilitator CzcD-associated flavoprotein CzcO